ncbi:MAG: porin [Coprobacter sp.]|nr:porin [Coprobacter sp.]
MKKKLHAGILLCCTLLALPVAAQQEESRPREIIFLWGRGEGPEEIVEIFDETQSQHFQDPQAPRFLLIDQRHRVALGIGGYVKMTVSDDFKGISESVDFIPFDIPVPNNGVDNGQFQMDVFTSRLFLKLVGNNRVLGNYTAYIETDFRGYRHALHLRQAYVSMRGFLLGQSWSTFSDVAAMPPTIDFQGPNGNTDLRNVQLRYTFGMGKHWKAALALEAPGVSYTLAGRTGSLRQRMPDIPLWLQFGWGKSSHIRASALFRGLSYRNEVLHRNRMCMGWGVQLSGVAELGRPVTFYYQGTYGKGIARYVADLSDNNLDLVPDPEKPGHLQALPVLAAVGGLQWNISSKFFTSANYSFVRIRHENAYAPAAQYKLGQYICGNLFCHLTPDCMIGVEYLHGIRENDNTRRGHANRIQASVQYNF